MRPARFFFRIISIVFGFAFLGAPSARAIDFDSLPPISADRCLGTLAHADEPFEIVKPVYPVPKEHLGNYANLPYRVKKGTPVAIPRGSKIRFTGVPLKPENEFTTLIVDQVAEAGKVFSAPAPYGRRYFRIREMGKETWLVEVDVAGTPFKKTVTQPPVEDTVVKKRDWTGVEDKTLAEEMAKSQARASHTVNGSSKSGAAAEKRIVEANRLLAHLFSTGSPLTATVLEKVNFAITEDSLRAHAAMTGLVRGRGPRTIVYKGKPYVVDLSQAQIGNSYPIEFWYLPAAEVVPALEKWLERANRVSKKSGLKELVELYRDFIVIHPFVDGNGRTARAVYDFLTLRAGLPLVPHDLGLTRDVILKTIDEIYANFLAAYATSKP
jgi:hypothetical protein